MSAAPPATEIEVLMVADWAQAIGGKLYVQGGGFSDLVIEDSGSPTRFAIAAILRAAPGTQGALPLLMQLEDGSGNSISEWRLSGELEIDAELADPGTAAIAGTVDAVLPVDADVVLRARFADAERTVAFRTVRRG